MGWLAIDGRSRVLKRFYRAVIGRRIVRGCSIVYRYHAMGGRDYLGYGVERERIVMISNGINPEAFEEANDAEFRSRHGLDAR